MWLCRLSEWNVQCLHNEACLVLMSAAHNERLDTTANGSGGQYVPTRHESVYSVTGDLMFSPCQHIIVLHCTFVLWQAFLVVDWLDNREVVIFSYSYFFFGVCVGLMHPFSWCVFQCSESTAPISILVSLFCMIIIKCWFCCILFFLCTQTVN